MGTACPSTALAFFFHNTSASRGTLPLEAIEAGLFDDADVPTVKAFAEKVLTRMADGVWLANFASESVKSSGANIAIATTATPVERDGVRGWALNGEKSFGCATGIADTYLVTAKIDGTEDANGLALFLVPRDAEGVGERPFWNGLGMRGSANHGVTLSEVFIPGRRGADRARRLREDAPVPAGAASSATSSPSPPPTSAPPRRSTTRRWTG